MTTFSLIIPTYNRRAYLMACLESVAAQRHRPDEVIVVDDGSTDGTLGALAAIEGVTVIEQANAGAGAARNRGAAVASGDYLVFIDSDDVWFPWSLEVFARLVERHARPALLFGRYEDFAGDLVTPPEEPAQGRHFPTFLDASAYAFIAGAGMMVVDRLVFQDVGGFAEDGLNAEDHDFALRMGDAPGFVQVLQPTTIAHRMHAGNETANLKKSVDGLLRLVDSECAGGYPGGDRYRSARRTVITRYVRPFILQAIRSGEFQAAWKLYRRTFTWNARGGRAAFILAFPLLLLRAALLPIVRPNDPSSVR